MRIVISNKTEILYQQLKKWLFESPPFAQRMLITPSPSMKSWLMLQMASDPDLQIAMGFKHYHLEEALTVLQKSKYFTSTLELSLKIEQELYSILNSKNPEWQPLLNYFYKKNDRKITKFSIFLAHLFNKYKKYSKNPLEMLSGWQKQLWIKVCTRSELIPNNDFHIHLFALSHIPARYFDYFQKIQAPVFFYQISPSALFYSDFLTNQEENFFHKKTTDPSQQLLLEQFLENQNPLLANMGKVGREFSFLVESSNCTTEELFSIPHAAAENRIYGDLMPPGLFIDNSSQRLTLLNALQTDLLLMRSGGDKIDMDEKDGSLQIHSATTPMREVEILYNNLLEIIDHQKIQPKDILVMTPHIDKYAPFIHAIFNSQESLLKAEIFDQLQSPLQALLHILKLATSRWEASTVFRLFEFPSFQIKNQLKKSDVHTIEHWIKSSKVRWGKAMNILE